MNDSQRDARERAKLPNIDIVAAESGPGGRILADGEIVTLSTGKGFAATVNIMEVIMFVAREAIAAANEDKDYYLKKLEAYNRMGEALSGYLTDLAGAARELAIAEARGETLTPSPVTIMKFDLEAAEKAGNLLPVDTTRTKLDRNGLSDTIKEVESLQESVRNRRQMASTAFQNFDQKANQLLNLLSSVMKAMNEMRMGTTRNFL